MNIDREIARLMGKPWCKPKHGSCCTCQGCGWDHDNCQCGYSEDIEMAFNVVEKMDGLGFEFTLMRYKTTYRALFVNNKTRASGDGIDTIPAMAICLAALKAVEE